MLTYQRKHYLLDLLQREGQIVAKAVSDALGLSEDTIRRDLRELAKEGLLQRVHGGAIPNLPASPALAPYASREQISQDAKPAIGRAHGGAGFARKAEHRLAIPDCTIKPGQRYRRAARYRRRAGGPLPRNGNKHHACLKRVQVG